MISIFRRLRAIYRTGLRLLRIRFPRRLRLSIGTIFALQAVGTFGYPLIEGHHWSLFDGLYMTAITLATIGYGETHPLSPAGRAFTVLLAYSGIFTLAYFASETVRMVVTGELRDLLGKERMKDALKHLRRHTIVCGYGRMGRIACDELERQGESFVVVDTGDLPHDWSYQHGLHVRGNAADDAVLKQARIDRARALITALGSDADNLYITLSAKLLNPQLCIVARAEEVEAEAKLRRVGATRVISPYLVGGHRAVQAVLRPNVLQFLDSAMRPEFLDLVIEEIAVLAQSPLAGMSLGELRLAGHSGIIVVGVVPTEGPALYSPPDDSVIAVGSTLIVLGHRTQLDRVEALASPPVES